MAYIKTAAIIEEITGHALGVSFRKNNFGNQIAQPGRPVQPNTPAQARAKQSFKNAAGYWSALTFEEKAPWTGFASESGAYQPVDKKKDFKDSGRLAFQSITNVATAVSDTITTKYAGNKTGMTFKAAAITGRPTVPVKIPPTSILLANVGIGSSKFSSLLVTDIVTSIATSKLTIKISMDGNGSIPVGDLKDANNNSIGYNVYVSSPLRSPGSNPTKTLIRRIATTGIINVPTAISVTSGNVDLVLGLDGTSSDYLLPLAAGQNYLISVVLMSSAGAQVIQFQKKYTLQ